MSVGAAVLMVSPRSGEKTYRNRVYERTYEVVCTALTDTEAAVLGASGLPAIGAAHPGDSKVYCKNLRATRVEGLTWHVTARYEVPQSSTGGEYAEDPTTLDPEITFGDEVYEEAADKDKDGVAVLTSAKRPFDPPLMLPWPRRVIVITRNEATFNAATAEGYINTVNSAQITVAGLTISAGCGLMRRLNAQKAWAPNGDAYWIVTYEIAVDNRRGWTARVLDQDYYTLDKNCCKDESGRPATRPMPLNGYGYQLAAGGTPVFLTFTVYTTAAWSGLSLPSTA